MDNPGTLHLDKQLCFALYAGSKEVIRLYKPFLSAYGLTYTQYIVLLVLWEEDHITVSDLGNKLHLDSGTLTPLLKKLEAAGILTRDRSKNDERTVIVSLTKAGLELQKAFLDLPQKMFCQLGMTSMEAGKLKELLDTLLKNQVLRNG
ncbi:MAG: MarR family transcriptional regulator [Eubacteriales bacterium]